MLGGGAWGVVARRPHLWGSAFGAAWSMRRRRWWLSFPFLPIPDRRLLGWRLATAYGTAEAPLVEQDLMDFLEWRRRWSRWQ